MLSEMENKMKKITVLLLALSLVATMLVSCKKDKNKELESVDIIDGDLSEYVEIDEKYYKGYTVRNNLNVLVANEIIKEQFKHRSEEPVEGDGIITVGDVVNIFYKGYYMSGQEKVYFAGGSNIGQSAHKLEIGSGGFIPGFEYNMIGKNPAQYSESNPMVIETYFPAQYQSAELEGKTAYFEVYLELKDGKCNMTEYSVPEINDSYITETLKITEETLASYEGETLKDRYFSYSREEYVEKNSFTTETLAITAFWESVMTGAVVKKYPEKELLEAQEYLKEQAKSVYDSYPYYAYSYTLDQFICAYYGYDTSSDVDEVISTVAKEQLKRQLILYHVMNMEGLKPTAEEYERMFDSQLKGALESNEITPENFSTQEEYLAKKAEYKAKLIEQYGEDYFKALIYQQIGMSAIVDYAIIVDLEAKI